MDERVPKGVPNQRGTGMAERITKTLLKELPPATGERIIFDSEVRGFGVRIRPGAQPSFFFRYSDGRGGKKKIVLGRFGDLTPELARRQALELRQKVTLGADPAESRRQQKAMPTLRNLAERYMNEHAIPHKKPWSVVNDRLLWNKHILPLLGDVRVDQLEERHVLTLKTKLAKKSATSRNAHALLSKALTLAETWKYRPQRSNPCYLIEKAPAVKRERILVPEELTRFAAALEAHESECPHVVALARVLLFTGARLREIMDARLTQLVPDRKLLLLPDSKTGQGQIELSEAALEILLGIQRGNSPWLIPGRDGRPLGYPKYHWKRICRTAGLEGFRIHDLRHCFGSYSHRAGVSQKEIAKLLRHQQLATTERYIQGFDAERNAAANRTAKALKELLQPSAAKRVDNSRNVA